MSILLQNPFLKIIILFAVLINLLGSNSDALLNISLLTKSNLWFGNLANTIAIVSISSSLGMLLGSLFTKDFFKEVKSLTIISLLLANTTFLGIQLIFFPTKLLMVLSLFTLGYLIGKINPRLSAYIIGEVPQEKLGLTSGVFSILVLSGAPLGQLILLDSANLFSEQFAWALFSGLSLVFLIFSLSFNRKVIDPITATKS